MVEEDASYELNFEEESKHSSESHQRVSEAVSQKNARDV